VVLRPEAIRERLLRLEATISRLEELGRLGPEGLHEDFRNAWAAERGLQLAAEIVFDVGNHILSARFGVSAQDYEDIIVQLGAHGAIGPTLQDRLKGLGGFRNLLVHGYLRVDPERVAEQLVSGPPRFAAFIDAIREWLASQEPSGRGGEP